ncbi:MAG TPA: hypothetical protein DD458_16880 [Prolixibacteraceae bacterium]|nr:MAG: hypothetical protein A2W89_12345 [Bacteroidetes bacterium GWE2_42_39]HBL76904.1 hypothetical protein [Prolixibacteraceae bacterium]
MKLNLEMISKIDQSNEVCFCRIIKGVDKYHQFDELFEIVTELFSLNDVAFHIRCNHVIFV